MAINAVNALMENDDLGELQEISLCILIGKILICITVNWENKP